MLKEYHLVIDHSDCEYMTSYIYTNIYDTALAIALGEEEIIYSTQPHFLSFSSAKRLFIHVHNKQYEIKLGRNSFTNTIIKETTDIESLLFAGEFKFDEKKE